MTVSTIPHILVAGLGNYSLPNTRHSIGHVIIDALAAHHRISMSADRSKGSFFGTGNVLIADTPISLSLFKSKSAMNISGPSIISALRSISPSPSSPDPNSLILISDSLSHKPCKTHVRLGGSANGHNGVKSVINALRGNDQFWRIRVGIGKNEGVDAAEYVMRRLDASERLFWAPEGPGVGVVMRDVEKIVRQRIGG